jgi:nitrogen-specific signal transduction histidine kinase
MADTPLGDVMNAVPDPMLHLSASGQIAAANAAARALYARAGFAPTGQRRGYYARAGSAAVDALTLTLVLGAQIPGSHRKS